MSEERAPGVLVPLFLLLLLLWLLLLLLLLLLVLLPTTYVNARTRHVLLDAPNATFREPEVLVRLIATA